MANCSQKIEKIVEFPRFLLKNPKILDFFGRKFGKICWRKKTLKATISDINSIQLRGANSCTH